MEANPAQRTAFFPPVRVSPQFYARLGGFLYLLIIVLGFVSEVIRDKVTEGNVHTNLASMADSWRLGIVAEFAELICVAGIAMVYFFLLNPVSRELNLVATFLRIIGTSIEALAVLELSRALFYVTGSSAGVFNASQSEGLIKIAIRAHGQGFALALLFFGACFLIHGYLIRKGGFLPGVFGWLIQLAGICYMSNSLIIFLFPQLTSYVFPWILMPCFIAEFSLCLRLLIKGVNVERWKALDKVARDGHR